MSGGGADQSLQVVAQRLIGLLGTQQVSRISEILRVAKPPLGNEIKVFEEIVPLRDWVPQLPAGPDLCRSFDGGSIKHGKPLMKRLVVAPEGRIVAQLGPHVGTARPPPGVDEVRRHFALLQQGPGVGVAEQVADAARAVPARRQFIVDAEQIEQPRRAVVDQLLGPRRLLCVTSKATPALRLSLPVCCP